MFLLVPPNDQQIVVSLFWFSLPALSLSSPVRLCHIHTGPCNNVPFTFGFPVELFSIQEVAINIIFATSKCILWFWHLIWKIHIFKANSILREVGSFILLRAIWILIISFTEFQLSNWPATDSLNFEFWLPWQGHTKSFHRFYMACRMGISPFELWIVIKKPRVDGGQETHWLNAF